MLRYHDAAGRTYEVPEPPAMNLASGIADLTLASAIHRHLVLVLDYTCGDLTWAAEELNVNVTTLWRMRQRLLGVADRRPLLKIAEA